MSVNSGEPFSSCCAFLWLSGEFCESLSCFCLHWLKRKSWVESGEPDRSRLFQFNHRVRNNDGQLTTAVPCCTAVIMAWATQRKVKTTGNGRIFIRCGTERLGTTRLDVADGFLSVRLVGSKKSIKWSQIKWVGDSVLTNSCRTSVIGWDASTNVQASWRSDPKRQPLWAVTADWRRVTYAWPACCSCVHVWSTGDSPPLGCESSLWQPHQDQHPEYMGWWSRGWRDEEGWQSLPRHWSQQLDLEGHRKIISLSQFSAVESSFFVVCYCRFETVQAERPQVCQRGNVSWGLWCRFNQVKYKKLSGRWAVCFCDFCENKSWQWQQGWRRYSLQTEITRI